MKVCPDCRRCYEDSFDSCVHDQSALTVGRPGARLVARKYALERLLEDSAGQTVYSGRHTETGRPYAVKLLLPDESADDEAAKNFRRAALATAHLNTRVDHQHVAKTYDYGLLPDGAVYVVTEMVGGRSLRRHLDEAGPLPASTAAHIARQVADGLAAAHRHGVAHHDLDPSHIVLTRGHDERPEVKIVDFGLAAPSKQGAAEQAGGPPDRGRSASSASPYSAPEQLDGQNPDARADLYSLGAVLYEMLSGSPPPAAAGHEHEEEPAPLSPISDGVPEPLSRLVSQLLSVRPSARPHSAAEVSKRLRAIEEMLAAGYAAAPAADGQALPDEEPALPTGSHAAEQTPAAVGTAGAAPTTINQSEGAHELEPNVAAYDDLDALQEELGANLDEIIAAASAPANLQRRARSLQPAHAPPSASAHAAKPPAAGTRRPVTAGKPRLARLLLATLAAITTGVACGLWLTSRSASTSPPAPPQSDAASSAARQSETAAAETPSNVEAGGPPAGDELTPPAGADDQSPEAAQGAADERAAEGVDAPSPKVVEAKPAAEGEARRGAAAAPTAPAGTAVSTASVERETGGPSDGLCALSVSESSLSIPAGGGSGTINVSVSGAARVRATTNNWQDIAVFSDARAGEGGRVRYTVISVSKRPGTFAVNFNSPCGTKIVPVTVRQR